MTHKPVLIAGAGIAGLSAAIALTRDGIPVTIVERRTGFTEVGAGLQLSPNATRALAELDLLEGVMRHSVTMQDLVIRRWADAAPLGSMPMQSRPEGDAAPFLALRRADLQTVLLDTLRMQPGIKLMMGRTVVGHADGADGLVVTLENQRGQREEIGAAALIAADGVWSSLREQVDGADQPVFRGYEAWRTLIPIGAVPPGAGEPRVNLWLGGGCHAVHYPVAGARMVNLVVVQAGRDAAREWDRSADGAVAPEAGGSIAPQLWELMLAAPQWRRWSLYDRDRTRMAKGRVAFIGDAAHPVLPFLAQGACLAIEDAVTLAPLLAPALAAGGGAVERALAAYGRLRQGRAVKVQKAARTNGNAYHAGFPINLARNLVLRQLGPAGMRQRYGWLYGWTPP